MGLLDDAIREHLELKRRRGADPGEVERQEREVLGAAPQAGEFAQPEPAEEPLPESDEIVAEAAGPVDAGDEREPFDIEAMEPETPVGEPDPWLEEERDEGPAEESLGQEPAARPPAEEPDAEEPAEDVLEDTPDFLQETPEHDRLWFEQRPPRDFDWDK
jgi:hypothetical protein